MKSTNLWLIGAVVLAAAIVVGGWFVGIQPQLGATAAAMLVLVRRWLRGLADAPVWLPLLAFPALWIDLGNGQNAALTTAIFAGGALLLPKRPWLAGAVFAFSKGSISPSVVSIGQDAAGEMVLVGYEGNLYKVELGSSKWE